MLSGLYFLLAILSYLMRLTDGMGAVKMVIISFILFMIPIAGEWIVMVITVTRMKIHDFIRS